VTISKTELLRLEREHRRMRDALQNVTAFLFPMAVHASPTSLPQRARDAYELAAAVVRRTPRREVRR
jgi:hypothetical protein